MRRHSEKQRDGVAKRVLIPIEKSRPQGIGGPGSPPLRPRSGGPGRFFSRTRYSRLQITAYSLSLRFFHSWKVGMFWNSLTPTKK